MALSVSSDSFGSHRGSQAGQCMALEALLKKMWMADITPHCGFSSSGGWGQEDLPFSWFPDNAAPTQQSPHSKHHCS